MHNHPLFSYGTLQNPEVQLKLFGREIPVRKEILTGYRLETTVITDQQFLAGGNSAVQNNLMYTGDELDRIEGMVFFLSSQELLIADQYEPIGYRRIFVTLQSGIQAWVYVM